MLEMSKFENCISLGWFCGTASSLEKLGLRSFSGPFDWLFSDDFSVVLKLMDKDFLDFMKEENLVTDDVNAKRFRDIKNGLIYNHDVKSDFDIERKNIIKKYSRRVKRFQTARRKPTMFFRTVRSNEEVKWIIENTEYINRVIKQFNNQNSITYILLKEMNSLPDEMIWFRLNVAKYSGTVYEMRNLFNQSGELISYCESLLSTDKVTKNLLFDYNANGWAATVAEVQHEILNDIGGVDDKIKRGLEISGGCEYIYIFGAGHYGIGITEYLLRRNISVKAIIDNNQLVRANVLTKVPIIPFADVDDGARIFISVADESISNEIVKQIRGSHRLSRILTYKELSLQLRQ